MVFFSVPTRSERVAEKDLDKVRSTLKSMMREWSADGAAERARCYQPFIDELMQRYPDPAVRARISGTLGSDA